MSQYDELTEGLGSRLSDLIEQIQTLQTDAIKAVRQRVEPYLPDLPTLPLFADLPKPAQVARANFALAEQLLRAQKSYTLGVLEALGGPVERAESKPVEAVEDPPVERAEERSQPADEPIRDEAAA